MNREGPMMTFMKLPNDLVLNCLARVSRLYYPTLSLVSKKFRSLLASPELYKTRKFLGRTESCLYLCLLFDGDSKPHWFTLGRRPNQSPIPRWLTHCFRPNPVITHYTKKKKKKSSKDNVLIPIPSNHSFRMSSTWDSFTAVGSNIYHIGIETTKVYFLDCWSHTWHEAPNMMLGTNKYPLVNLLDEKIYVTKGLEYSYSHNHEIFDPKTQIWENLQNPRRGMLVRSLAIEGKLYFQLDRNKFLVYKPNENRWDEEESNMSFWSMDWTNICWNNNTCVIDDVLYLYNFISGKILWYDSKAAIWRFLNGLGKKMRRCTRSNAHVKLVNYGGKMTVFWYMNYRSAKLKIWCAEIALERRNEHEISGKVERFGVVLKAPFTSWSVMHVIATTV